MTLASVLLLSAALGALLSSLVPEASDGSAWRARLAWAAFAVLILTGIWNIGATSHHDSSANGYSATLGIKLGFVVLSGLAAWWHQRAKSRFALAVGGAAAGLFALLPLFLGVVLAEH